MRNLILWLVVFVLYLIRISPWMELSEGSGVRLARNLLNGVIGFVVGSGISNSLTEMLVK